jgi:ATP-dependent exoDNAse (exonuclease V) alpha subunit
VAGTGIELLEQRNPGKSVVRFPVKKKMDGDDDGDEMDMETNVPFQIAYAVSIHKAQGLEYKSVKIIITKEVDELISHNIFYTAITRAKEKLKIYWTAESQQKILSSFKDDMTLNDAKIFAARKGLRIVKRRAK